MKLMFFRLEDLSVNVRLDLLDLGVKGTSMNVSPIHAVNPEHRAVYNSLITTGQMFKHSRLIFIHA